MTSSYQNDRSDPGRRAKSVGQVTGSVWRCAEQHQLAGKRSEYFPEKWTPVFRKEMRQSKDF